MFIEKHWYRLTWLSFLLLPLSAVFWLVVVIRRAFYRSGLLRTTRLPVPVVVVGNIVVGGTGKTPLVVWLVNHLRQQGYHPGIVSRGYRVNVGKIPRVVLPDSTPGMVGDEALMLVRKTQVPMMICPDRVAAAKALLASNPTCDVIISDDGLQHYALGRDIEIAVIDGDRRCGNHLLLPAGPLRERRARLKQVNFIICNGKKLAYYKRCGEYEMKLVSQHLTQLINPAVQKNFSAFLQQTVHAVAGIGHPERFFKSLENLGLTVIPHAFPDHHHFSEEELAFSDDLPIVMTEKDAVKCLSFAKPHWWALPVAADIDPAFAAAILEELK